MSFGLIGYQLRSLETVLVIKTLSNFYLDVHYKVTI